MSFHPFLGPTLLSMLWPLICERCFGSMPAIAFFVVNGETHITHQCEKCSSLFSYGRNLVSV